MKSFLIVLFFLTSLQLLGISKVDSEKLKNSIVEVVVPKFDDFPELNRTIDINSIPYRDRNSHFTSIGTAFFVNSRKLITAAHVLNFYQRSPRLGMFYIRDHTGHVYEIDKIYAYDSERDFAVFGLQYYPKNIRPLKYRVAKKSDLGIEVCTPGNANGLGLSYRCGGQISSFKKEHRQGRWHDLYFSTPTSPGNSGGPLITPQGHVLGVIVRGTRAENQNIATPIKEVLSTKSINILDSNAKYRDYSGRVTKLPLRIQFYQPLKTRELWKKVRIAKTRHFRKMMGKHYRFYRKNSFPHDRRLKIAFRNGIQRPFSSGTVHSNNSRDWSYSPFIFSNHSLGHNQTLSMSATKAFGFNAFYVDHDFNLNQYILDEFIRTFPSSIDYYGESYRIISFGKARKSKKIRDKHNRIWKFSLWESKALNSQRVLVCSPVPKGSFCLTKDIEFSSITNDTIARWNRALNQITFQYEGTPAEWNKFIDRGYEPSFISDNLILANQEVVDIELHGQDLQMRGVSYLSLYTGLIPSRSKGVRMHINSAIAKFKDQSQLNAYTHLKPTMDASDTESRLYDNLKIGVKHYQEMSGFDTYLKVTNPNKYNKVVIKCSFPSVSKPLEACLELEDNPEDY